MQFTKEQEDIINHAGGHARVRAVAGSGKTTTMVERIAHLLEQGVAPASIMVLMFNKSARDAFAESLDKRLDGTPLQAPEIRTFHALGLRLVESFSRRGALANMRLVTENHVQEALARKVAQHVVSEIDDAWSVKDDLEEFMGFIDLVKASRKEPAVLAKDMDLPNRFSSFVEGYELFEKARRDNKIRFYSDLIVDPLDALEGDEELQTWVANRVDYIIVDEYQDINEAQQKLLTAVAGTRAQVMVVGDGDQCIYEWRGAKPEYIASRFAEDFPNPVDYALSLSFRYGHSLCLAANHLIAHNTDAARSLCRAHPANPKTEIHCHETTVGTRNPVIDIVRDWQLMGRSLHDIVVLVRLYGMSVPTELAFLSEGIPYRLEGGRTVFNCPEIMALTGYLKLCLGRLDAFSCGPYIEQMFAQPHTGLKKSAQERLIRSVTAAPMAASSLIVQQITSKTPVYHRKRLEKLADTWQWLMDEPDTTTAHKLLKRLVARLDLYQFFYDFSSRESVAENRIQTCESLISFAAEREMSVLDFVDELERLQNQEQTEEERVLITSIHRAKGLEWPSVILPGLVQGSFPFTRMDKGAGDKQVGEGVEDERRLFYVGITRAIEHLHILHPVDFLLQESMGDGRAGVLPGNERPNASCFLYEANIELSSKVADAIYGAGDVSHLAAIDADMVNTYLALQAPEIGAIQQKKKITSKQGLTAVEQAGVKTSQDLAGQKNAEEGGRIKGADAEVGMAVVHERFGHGTIKKVIDKKQGKVSVDFETEGVTILLLNYAKLFRA